MRTIEISDQKQFKLNLQEDTLNGTRETCNEWIKENIPTFIEFKKRVKVCLNNAGYSNEVLGQLGESLEGKNRIIYIDEEHELEDHDIPIFWGVLHGNSKLIWRCIEERRMWIFCDHAYLNRGHENKNYRMTINSYGMKSIKNWGGERFTKMGIDVKEWRKQGQHVLICPPTTYFMKHHKVKSGWADDIKDLLMKYTDREIRVRKKPIKGGKGPTLEDDLINCHAVISHMSNVAVDAVVKGIPVFVNHNSAAQMVGSTHLNEIESPVICDRKEWLNSLAWNQFTDKEISSGDALKIIYMNAFK